jgi:replicative DNA helicase
LGCQINRGTTATADKRPNKNHLRGSGEIAEKAENVILLFRPGLLSKDPYDDTLEFIVEKARNGVTGVVKLTYDFRTSYLAGVKL